MASRRLVIFMRPLSSLVCSCTRCLSLLRSVSTLSLLSFQPNTKEPARSSNTFTAQPQRSHLHSLLSGSRLSWLFIPILLPKNLKYVSYKSCMLSLFRQKEEIICCQSFNVEIKESQTSVSVKKSRYKLETFGNIYCKPKISDFRFTAQLFILLLAPLLHVNKVKLTIIIKYLSFATCLSVQNVVFCLIKSLSPQFLTRLVSKSASF